ncbi:MAG TPA: ABC transporter substrate-binding protein [Stellaceae bacterium]|nr:ABC transporter substrate-binding protein [Stellaceae bacterium]
MRLLHVMPARTVPPRWRDRAAHIGVGAVLGVLTLFLSLPCAAATLRWAARADVRSLDPYAGRETFLRSFTENIYEPLVRRGRELALEPGLATSWKVVAPDRWRFALRPGVVFQGGEAFTAADVVYSFTRARAPESRIGTVLASIASVRALDPMTVEIATNGPDPLLLDELSRWPIMSRAWCEAHAADADFAADHADGTGPFMLVARVPDKETVLVPNPHWWDKPTHDLDRVEFTPIADPDMLVAALAAHDIDMIYDVPPQDADRIARMPGLAIVEGPALETIFLGFDVAREQSPDGARNPFKDRRIREAFAHGIDEAAIIARVMRGHATPAGLVVGPGIEGYDRALDTRPAYDPALARRLLAGAGFGQGFATPMDCPTDRYVNDEAICEQIVADLARIGVKVTLDAESRADFFDKIMPPGRRTSFFLLGGEPASDDAQGMLVDLAATRDPAAHQGGFNIAGYSNPALDRLVARARAETDLGERRALLRRALTIVKNDLPYLPLHRQNILWAVSADIELVQRPDDTFPLRYVRMK